MSSNSTSLTPDVGKRSNWTTGLRGVGKELFDRLVRLSLIIFIIALWWVVSISGIVSRLLLPSPLDVIHQFKVLAVNGKLLGDTEASLTRVLGGFMIALLLGVAVGCVMGLWKTARRAIAPLVEAVRPIPPIALIPLVMLWFGIGEVSKFVVVAFGAIFPILLNTLQGFDAIEEVHLRAVRCLGGGRRDEFRHVIIPTITPFIVVGARLGLAMAFIVLVAAELIAANRGLGFLIEQGQTTFNTSDVIVGIIVIALLSIGLNAIMLRIQRHFGRWREV